METPKKGADKKYSSQLGSFFCLLTVILIFSLYSCLSNTAVQPNSGINNSNSPASSPAGSSQQGGGGGIVEEIRILVELATPSSLMEALEIIRSRNLGATEYGRVMTAVINTLYRNLYSPLTIQLPASDPPLTHSYTRILRDIDSRIYTTPQPNSTDYLEIVLPFLALYSASGGNPGAEQYQAALRDLGTALRVSTNPVLANYFIATAHERSGRIEEANRIYTELWETFPDLYLAAIGMARIMGIHGNTVETISFLQNLLIQMPDNNQIKRQLALAYYNTGDWLRAESAVAEILQINARDIEFVLLRAHIMVEQGRLTQAQAPLDIYAAFDPNNRLYLYLRARIQAEAFNNRDSALNYLRALARNSQNIQYADREIIYAIRLFLDSGRQEDQEEGRALLNRFLQNPNPPLEIISLALDDAIKRQAWTESRLYLEQLLLERRSFQDLMAAYTIEKEIGNNAAALSYARELYSMDSTNEEGAIAYITALIDTGRGDEAASIIDNRLIRAGGGNLRSRYFFLRSRIRNNEELQLSDLRSSLFEDPRNLDSLIAMFEIYFRRRDERRAGYYLRQALGIAPNDQRLRRFEAEFIGIFGSL